MNYAQADYRGDERVCSFSRIRTEAPTAVSLHIIPKCLARKQRCVYHILITQGGPVLSDQTVLVVDDDVEMQKFLRDVLVSQGFTVHTVGTGREAISQAFALRPDLILLDLIMATLDGIGVCKALRTNEKTQHTPILVVTGSLSNKQIEESMTSGADDFISKPVDVQDMLVRVQALLKCRDIVDPVERLSRYVEIVRQMGEEAAQKSQPAE